MNSNDLQSPLEAPPQAARAAPAIVLPGNVLIFASRLCDRINGRVEFPYEVGGRTSVPIEYINTGPVPQTPRAWGPTSLETKAAARLALIEKWRKLCIDKPTLPRAGLARMVASNATIRCSVRSLQLWAKKLDADGPQALSDQYTPAPRKALSLDSKRATDAVSMCAWWAFRVGNVDRIDAVMMHHADQALRSSLYLADVLAAIDCYYAWPTDRAKYPFKPFARWCRYDVLTWIGRANDKDDCRSRLPEDRTPLLPGDTSDQTFAGVPGPKERRRDVNHRPTKRAIDDLKDAEAKPEGVGQSVHEAIMALDEPMRIMLFAAARGDSEARAQAVATMPLWWDRMPESTRNNIDVWLEVWKRDHARSSDRSARAVQLSMLFRELCRQRRDFNQSPVTLGATV